MKKHLLTLLAVCFGALTAGAESRIEIFTFRSAILGAEKSCSVYLPDGYDEAAESYPVLYLLHGSGGTHRSWPERGSMQMICDDMLATGMVRPMVIVMPDASGEGERHTGLHLGYFDVPGWSYERFFFEELIPTVEQRYRICGDRLHRAIAGYSMGGGGTATYALHHPEVFGTACPLSGLLDVSPRKAVRDDNYLQSIADNAAVKLLRELPEERLDAIRGVRWWVDCGDDDHLWQSNVEFYTLMRQRNIPVQFRIRDGGHNWHYWRTVLPDVLLYVSTGFGR